MVLFQEVTETKTPAPEHLERRVWLPCLTKAEPYTDEYFTWMKSHQWMLSYQVWPENKVEAVRLSQNLQETWEKDPNDPSIKTILDALYALRLKPVHELSPLEKWTRGATQFVEYCGGPLVYEFLVSELSRYSGNVLEAMCGHLSYFEEAPGRVVTALDYCTESLKKYAVPSRRRIECDLNQIREGVQLSCFDDAEFDVVSICFGFRYPEDMDALASEFRRILKPGGVLSFVENPQHGYPELYQRQFSKKGAIRTLVKSGFSSVRVKALPIPRKIWSNRQGTFYHTEAIK